MMEAQDKDNIEAPTQPGNSPGIKLKNDDSPEATTGGQSPAFVSCIPEVAAKANPWAVGP